MKEVAHPRNFAGREFVIRLRNLNTADSIGFRFWRLNRHPRERDAVKLVRESPENAGTFGNLDLDGPNSLRRGF